MGQHYRLLIKLVVVVAIMFAFSYALVPLYGLFCQITGIGVQEAVPSAKVSSIDHDRQIKVVLVANNANGMSWNFYPKKKFIHVTPGKSYLVNFRAENTTNNLMVGRAIYSPRPVEYRDYIHKTQCFCFEEQTLKAGESVDMPMVFMVSSDIPKEAESLILSYELFDITHRL